MIDYKKRLVEVDEILNQMSYEDLSKIPEAVRKMIKETKDKNYIWTFDKTKELKNQNLSRDTMIILSYFNMEYMLSNEQKILMEQIHNLNEKAHRKIEKNTKLFNENRYNNSLKNTDENINKQETKNLETLKEKNVFTKIIEKIKSIFK